MKTKTKTYQEVEAQRDRLATALCRLGNTYAMLANSAPKKLRPAFMATANECFAALTAEGLR